MVWYVLSRDSDEVLRRMLDFKVVEKRKHGQPNMTWKRQAEEHIDKIVLKKEDASNRTKVWC